MTNGIARGYERLAIHLHNHTHNYVPKPWVLPVGNVAFAPSFMASEARELMEAHREGELAEKLDEMGKDPKNVGQFEPWYIKAAVTDFFENERFAPYASEMEPAA